jgi:hypothetical protein
MNLIVGALLDWIVVPFSIAFILLAILATLVLWVKERESDPKS